MGRFADFESLPRATLSPRLVHRLEDMNNWIIVGITVFYALMVIRLISDIGGFLSEDNRRRLSSDANQIDRIASRD